MRYFNKILIAGIIMMGLLSISAMYQSDGIHGEVVCFGDSITHGAHVNGQSWVYFLSKNHTKNVTFINAGRNGRKTSDKKELLPVLKKYPHADYFLIFLGVNDLKDGTSKMVDQCITNMQWMINKIHESDKNTRIVILAPTDINLKTMSRLNVRKKYNKNTKRSLVELKNKYKKLAAKDHVKFLSLLHVVSKTNYVDGLHPDIKGQKQIARAVWKGMNRLF